MRALLTVLCLALPALAHAKCASRSMTYWPPADQPIATSGLMYIQGYGDDQAIVRGLKRVALKSGGETIPLEPVVTHQGAMRVTQTVYRAAKPLKAGTRYTLVLTGKSKTWRPTRWLEDERARVSWTAAEVPTVRWTGTPSGAADRYTRFGCGPAIYKEIALPLSTRSGLIEVVLKGGSSEQRYALPVPREGDLGIGHGMCSGAFHVGDKGKAFAAELALLQADGTRVPAPSAVQFAGVAP